MCAHKVLKNEFSFQFPCIFQIYVLYLRHLIYDFDIYEIADGLMRPASTLFYSLGELDDKCLRPFVPSYSHSLQWGLKFGGVLLGVWRRQTMSFTASRVEFDDVKIFSCRWAGFSEKRKSDASRTALRHNYLYNNTRTIILHPFISASFTDHFVGNQHSWHSTIFTLLACDPLHREATAIIKGRSSDFVPHLSTFPLNDGSGICLSA